MKKKKVAILRTGGTLDSIKGDKESRLTQPEEMP
jgi:L-asparaginase/Glu-tRNA(Gln) amidotransferase subunit D